MRRPRPLRTSLRLLAPVALLVGACRSDKADSGGADAVQDIRTTDLALDLDALSGSAVVGIDPAPGSDSVWLEVKGLTIDQVRVDGVETVVDIARGIATIPIGEPGAPVEVAMDYRFDAATFSSFDGWMPDLAVSFLWPDNCANLFPCDPGTNDGVTFTMEVSGVDPDQTAIYPASTWTDAPSYMPGIAVGDYETLDLGTTTAGTHLSAWYLRDEGTLAEARAGTADLVAAFDYFEQTYGAYAFGDDVGTVQVDWGADSWGGMEHHPYFHVAMWDFGNPEAQVHEAAHGWFGGAVRLACWEDFVLSEGTVTYMAARGLEQVDGPSLWAEYVDDYLTPICEGSEVNAIVLPDGCNEIDFEDSPLWSLAPYMKGACFYEEVADLIGADQLDQVIADFYGAHVNGAASMEAMIEAIEAAADPGDTEAIDALVTDWLRTRDCPADYDARCRTHQR